MRFLSQLLRLLATAASVPSLISTTLPNALPALATAAAVANAGGAKQAENSHWQLAVGAAAVATTAGAYAMNQSSEVDEDNEGIAGRGQSPQSWPQNGKSQIGESAATLKELINQFIPNLLTPEVTPLHPFLFLSPRMSSTAWNSQTGIPVFQTNYHSFEACYSLQWYA